LYKRRLLDGSIANKLYGHVGGDPEGLEAVNKKFEIKQTHRQPTALPGKVTEEVALLNIGARHVAPGHANIEGSIVGPMPNGNDMCPFQQTLADSRFFRRLAQRRGYGLFSDNCPATSLNRVHETARQCLEAGTGVVLAGDDNDMAEIVQKNSVCRVPEMHGDPSTVRRLNSAERLNGLIGVVSKIPVHGSSDDVLLHRRVNQHIVFDKTA
jgi:hypothetical protein